MTLSPPLSQIITHMVTSPSRTLWSCIFVCLSRSTLVTKVRRAGDQCRYFLSQRLASKFGQLGTHPVHRWDMLCDRCSSSLHLHKNPHSRMCCLGQIRVQWGIKTIHLQLHSTSSQLYCAVLQYRNRSLRKDRLEYFHRDRIFLVAQRLVASSRLARQYL